MAGFKTHITGSTLAGIGLGVAGYAYGIPWPSCAIGGTLCSVAGMLPDLDSDSGTPVREMIGFLAAVVPALMIPRFVQLGMSTEHMVLAAIGIYAFIRFVLAAVFKHYTVHRGMWHSLPAAAIAGLLAFLLVSGTQFEIRLFKTAAVTLGFLVHLVMDEIWSLEVRRGRLHVKKSLGTALKLFTTNGLWPNVSAYGKLALLVVLVINDPYLMNQLGVEQPEIAVRSKAWLQTKAEKVETRVRPLLEEQLQDNRFLPWSTTASAPAAPPAEPPSLFPDPSAPPASPSEPQAETARRVSDYPTIWSPVRR
jgi:membrane-bound metal-dependent hydrolase YbcI (DUF457 family)